MREIKFRAWDKINKTMYQVRDIDFLADGSINSIRLVVAIQISDEDIDFDFPIRRGGQYEIMQFTGLLDKNGKEIYEGDILRLLETISTDDPAYPYYCDTMEVCYCEPHCRFGLTDGGAILDIPSNVEVIGNKFENPDLC